MDGWAEVCHIQKLIKQNAQKIKMNLLLTHTMLHILLCSIFYLKLEFVIFFLHFYIPSGFRYNVRSLKNAGNVNKNENSKQKFHLQMKISRNSIDKSGKVDKHSTFHYFFSISWFYWLSLRYSVGHLSMQESKWKYMTRSYKNSIENVILVHCKCQKSFWYIEVTI